MVEEQPIIESLICGFTDELKSRFPTHTVLSNVTFLDIEGERFDEIYNRFRWYRLIFNSKGIKIESACVSHNRFNGNQHWAYKPEHIFPYDEPQLIDIIFGIIENIITYGP